MSEIKTNLMNLLPLFMDKNVPENGEFEAEVDPITWDAENAVPSGDLSKYTFLMVGENHNRIFLIHEGTVVWKYDTGKGWELDDIWMLSNGNIIFTHMYWCAEVTPDKKQVWYYKVPEGCEVHTLQPIGLDKVMMIQNGVPPKIIIMNTNTNEIEYEHEIPYDASLPIHSQFRRGRMTKEGNFLLPYLDMHKVVEYDKDFNVVWQFNTERPWCATRLFNGNTLITDETEGKVKEVDKDEKLVWEYSLDEIPEEYKLNGSQSCFRISNGNTIICSLGGLGTHPQLLEVTPDKKVVWCIKDWKNLGPATSIQILTEPGIPEIPGGCMR